MTSTISRLVRTLLALSVVVGCGATEDRATEEAPVVETATCMGREATLTGDGEVVGTPGDDVIITGDGPDRVVGFAGDDLICTNDGDDVVDAGSGNDTVDGGTGSDICSAAEESSGCEDDLLVGPVIDSGVDLDDDGVDDEVEQRFGSSNDSSDSDGDGLTDYFEIDLGGMEHRPDDPDSDGDGIPDAQEDVDGDGSDAAAEQRLGTDPLTSEPAAG